MEKLTDAEVVKALEICTDKLTISCPNACPFYDECENDLCALERQALALIKRKDAELYVLNEALDGETVKNMRLKHEVERLKAEIRNTDNHLVSLDIPLIEAKIEAYKEFAERLEEIIPHYSDRYTTMECVMGAIRYIEKELTEGSTNGQDNEGSST